MQTALRKKTETGNEKDPSAALGMTKRGNASFHSFSTCCGSQPRLTALGSPFQGKGLAWILPPSYGRREYAASQTSHEEGLRYENAVFPILSFRAQARNLFRLRSGKRCEEGEEQETPHSLRLGRTVLHAGALRKKTEEGNEKDPSAALGMTKRGNASFHSFSTCCGSQPRLAVLGSPFQGKGIVWTHPPAFERRCPEGAEVGWGSGIPDTKPSPRGEGGERSEPDRVLAV